MSIRSLPVTNTEIDLSAVNLSFNPDYSVVVYNPTAGSLVLQQSDVSGSGFGTLATVAAHSYANVQLDKQFIKVSTVATMYMLGN